jgi:hypothetical protein
MYAAFRVHREDLIALVRFTGRLEDDLLTVAREVSFSIFSAGSQLPDIPEVPLPGVGLDSATLRKDKRGAGRSQKKCSHSSHFRTSSVTFTLMD